MEEFTVAGNFYQLLKDITDVGGDLLFEASPIGFALRAGQASGRRRRVIAFDPSSPSGEGGFLIPLIISHRKINHKIDI